LRADHKQDNERKEGDRVAIEPGTDEDRAVGFDESQHKTRHKRAAHAAKPAEDNDGERLVADDEANPWIDQVVQESDQPAGDGGERRSNGEVEVTDLDRVDAEACGDLWFRDGGAPAYPDARTRCEQMQSREYGRGR